MQFLKGGLLGIGILFLSLLGVLVIAVLPFAVLMRVAQYSEKLAVVLFVLAAAFILGGISKTSGLPGQIR